jgi:hypothetical protein
MDSWQRGSASVAAKIIEGLRAERDALQHRVSQCARGQRDAEMSFQGVRSERDALLGSQRAVAAALKGFLDGMGRGGELGKAASRLIQAWTENPNLRTLNLEP